LRPIRPGRPDGSAASSRSSVTAGKTEGDDGAAARFAVHADRASRDLNGAVRRKRGPCPFPWPEGLGCEEGLEAWASVSFVMPTPSRLS
jgi:hypothetical protein